MENLIIREAKEEDAERIITYLNMVGGESDNLIYGKNEFPMPKEQVENHLVHAAQADNSVVLVGLMGDQIVAAASLEGYSCRRMHHRARLFVSVRKKYWNKGIGTAMMDELIRWARIMEIQVIELEVLAGNPAAVTLCHKMGFWDIGVYEDFWFVNERFEDAILMCLRL